MQRAQGCQKTLKEELAVAVLVASSRCAFSEWKGRARSCSEMPTPPCSRHLALSKQLAALAEAGVSVTLQILCVHKSTARTSQQALRSDTCRG